MPIPKLELDDRFFTIIASNENAALVRCSSGNLCIFSLRWRDQGDYPPGFEKQAWDRYFALTTNGE